MGFDTCIFGGKKWFEAYSQLLFWDKTTFHFHGQRPDFGVPAVNTEHERCLVYQISVSADGRLLVVKAGCS